MYTISGPHCSGSESPLYKKPKAGQVCNVGIIGRNWGGTNLKLNGRRLRQVEWTIGGDFTHLRRGELGLGFFWRGEGSFKVMGLRWSALETLETTWNFQLIELGRKCCIPPPISQVMEICDAVGMMMRERQARMHVECGYELWQAENWRSEWRFYWREKMDCSAR